MIGADAVRVTGKSQPLCVGGGKTVSDLIGDDIKITWDGVKGSVTGELKKLDSWAEFDPAVSNGHFFPATLSAAYNGVPITVQKGDSVKTLIDRNWILLVEDKDVPITFSANDKVFLIFDFSGATLAE